MALGRILKLQKSTGVISYILIIELSQLHITLGFHYSLPVIVFLKETLQSRS